MGTRWKGKSAEAKALADPMSKIVSELSSSLIQSNARGLLTGCSLLVAVAPEQTELLTRACFGRPVINAEKDKQWFQLGLEEAFYVHYYLKCLIIVGGGGGDCEKNSDELWQYIKSKIETFPDLFKAYSHLRKKNWVVRPGSQYGVDFVAYPHHPSFVHSEYAVVVSSEDEVNGRLRIWSDFYCTIRLCGSVAKTLLVVNVSKHDGNGVSSPSCLEGYSVQEHVITRWSSEQSREDQTSFGNRTKSRVKEKVKAPSSSVQERTPAVRRDEGGEESGFVNEYVKDAEDEIGNLKDAYDIRDNGKDSNYAEFTFHEEQL